jgi:hypothetical protein
MCLSPKRFTIFAFFVMFQLRIIVLGTSESGKSGWESVESVFCSEQRSLGATAGALAAVNRTVNRTASSEPKWLRLQAPDARRLPVNSGRALSRELSDQSKRSSLIFVKFLHENARSESAIFIRSYSRSNFFRKVEIVARSFVINA